MAEHELNKIVDDDGEVFNLRDSTKQPVADRVTAWGSTPSDTKYPSEKLVKTSIDSSVLYANEKWGGAFRTSLSPFDNYAFKNSNCFFGAKPSAIRVEYSTDGGTTWTDYGLTDEQKVKLFSQYEGNSVYCGKNTHIQPGYTGSISGTKDLSNDNIADQRLRITICDSSLDNEGTTSTTDRWLYCSLRRIGIYMSTQSAEGGAHCLIEKRTSANFKSATNTWVTVGDYKIHGDTGWNSIPCGNDTAQGAITFGQNNSQYRQIRFTIWSDLLSASPAASQTGNLMIQKIVAFSENVWTNNSSNPNVASFGSPYSVIASTGVTNFPKGIKFTARKLKTNLARTADSTFDGSADQENIPVTGTLAPGNGGTGKTSLKAAEYNLTTGKSEISDTTSGDDRVVFELASPSESNGVTRGFRKLSTIWAWIKGLLSSESGVNISGNAATATALASGSADRTKLDGIAEGAEVNVQSDWNQTTTTADDYIKNKPTIPSGTQLVYDCGTGSTSTTDFDNALAAYNAGKWVIINKDGVIYHCVGTYNSNLRFKTFANESDLLKVRALTWTRGSAPAVGTTLEAALTSQIPDISGKVNKSGDTMSGNLTISKGANQGDTKFVATRTDQSPATTAWFGIGDGGKNHGVYSESAYANTNNDVDKDTKGWVVRTDENGYSSLTGAVNGLFAKDFGATETLRGMKMFRFGYSLDREGDYTHVSATAIIEVRIYYAGVAGSSITMLFNASARGDVGSYYRLQVLSYNNWNLNSVCPVLITREESATAKYMYLGLVGGGPTSTTLRTFNYTEVKVLPLNGTQKFNWSFGWNTNDFNSNTMMMIKPYVYPRAQIGTAIGDAGTPVYVKADGDFGTASGTDVAIALKDAGRADAPVTQDWRVKVGWGGSGVDACSPNGTSTYSVGQTVGTTKHLVTAYEYDGVGYYKDVQAGMVTVGNSERWNGYLLAVQNPGNTPAADTIYIF